MPNKNTAFKANLAAQPIPFGNQNKVSFSPSGFYNFNDGNHFFFSIGSHNVPSAGVYHFEISVQIFGAPKPTVNSKIHLQLIKNGSGFLEWDQFTFKDASVPGIYRACTVKLAAGDVMQLIMKHPDFGTTYTIANNENNYFSGFKVY